MTPRLLLAAAIGACLLAACGDATTTADARSSAAADAPPADVPDATTHDRPATVFADDAMADATTPASATTPAASGPGAWRYGREGSGDAERTFATVSGQVEGSGPATLTFSASDLGGRQARLEALPEAPDCAAGCRVELSVDGGASETVRATVPSNAGATLSLRDARDVWRSLEGARRLEVTYPGAGGASRTVRFDVGGVDAAALPGWK